MIHPNNRYSDETLIIHKNSTQTLATSNKNPAPIKQCRICLENQQQSSKNMISPCKCTGSVKYVHQQCIKSWIKSILGSKSRSQRTVINQEGMQCEMCKQNIKFNFQSYIGCRKCQQLGNTLRNKKLILFIVIILIMISAGGIVFCIIHIIELGLVDQYNGFQFILSICGLIVLFCFFSVGVYTSFVQFFLYKRLQIGEIKNFEMPRNFSISSLSIVDIV